MDIRACAYIHDIHRNRDPYNNIYRSPSRHPSTPIECVLLLLLPIWLLFSLEKNERSKSMNKVTLNVVSVESLCNLSIILT